MPVVGWKLLGQVVDQPITRSASALDSPARSNSDLSSAGLAPTGEDSHAFASLSGRSIADTFRVTILSDDTRWATWAMTVFAEGGIHSSRGWLNDLAPLMRDTLSDVVMICPSPMSADNWAMPPALSADPDRLRIFVGEDSLEQRLRAFRLGADACLSRDIDSTELRAAVGALVRRLRRVVKVQVAQPELYRLGRWLFNPFHAELTGPSGRVHRPTPFEIGLITTLLQQPGQVFSLDELATRHPALNAGRNSVRTRICRLRARLMLTEPEVDWIHTVYGKGYKIGVPVEVVKTSTQAASCESHGQRERSADPDV
jgi:DNA-binding winged helix-turn-helix (wHTH) protein